MALTVSAVQQNPLNEVARRSWGGDKAAEFDAGLVRTLYRKHLSKHAQGSSHDDDASVLELSGYLEKYLWPAFTPECTDFHHIMSLVLLVNHKADAGLPQWSAIGADAKRAKVLLYAVAALQWTHPGAMGPWEHEAVLHFFVAAYSALECGGVRAPLLRLCSLPQWRTASAGAVQRAIAQHPPLAKPWGAVSTKAAPPAVACSSWAAGAAAGSGGAKRPRTEGAASAALPWHATEHTPWAAQGVAADKWLETNFLPSTLAGLLATAEDPTVAAAANDSEQADSSAAAGAVAALCRALELCIDLLAQLSTRRFFLLVARDAHATLRLRRCATVRGATGPRARLVAQLTDMVEFMVGFEVDEHSGGAVSPARARAVQYARLQTMQQLLYKFMPQKAEDVALAAVGTLSTSKALSKAFRLFAPGTLLRLAQWLQLLPRDTALQQEDEEQEPEHPSSGAGETSSAVAGGVVGGSKRAREDEAAAGTAASGAQTLAPTCASRDFVMSTLLAHHAPAVNVTDELNALSLFPTERLLWDANLVPFGRYAPGQILALPKLNLQFLTLSDYLLRSFNLYRLEAAYEIRADLADTVARMQPVRKTTYNDAGFAQGATAFKGWSRMGLELPKDAFVIKDIAPPRAGEVAPAAVKAEVTYDLKSYSPWIRTEWDELREHDVVFMVTVRAEAADAEKAQALLDAHGDSRSRAAGGDKGGRKLQPEDDPGLFWRLGISHVRGAEVLSLYDEDGNVQNDPVEEARRQEAGMAPGPRGHKRTLALSMDANQYYLDTAHAKRAKPVKGGKKKGVSGLEKALTVRPAALVGIGAAHGGAGGSEWPGQVKGEDVYSTFNLLVRRRGKENNFKAVLEAIRDAMNACTAEANAADGAEDGSAAAEAVKDAVVDSFAASASGSVPNAAGGAAAAGSASLPGWLHEVLLGYGDPAAACPEALPAAAQVQAELDWRDTFQSGAHAAASFPGCDVQLRRAVPKTRGLQALLQLPPDAEEVTAAPAAWCDEDWDMQEVSLEEAGALKPPFRIRRGGQSVTITAYPRPAPGPFPQDVPPANRVPFTATQTKAIGSGMSHGLTMIVGPPGTGKTDTATQIIANLYHNFPNQKILLVTHSNQALNDLFAKLTQRDIAHRHMLRLGSGSRDLAEVTGGSDFSKWGRVASTLQRRSALLRSVQSLGASLGVVGDVGYTAETAGHFYLNHVLSRMEAFEVQLKAALQQGDAPAGSWVAQVFPFQQYFAAAPGGLQGLFPQGQDLPAAVASARACFRHLRHMFDEIADYRPFELLRTQRLRTDFMLTKQARIVAMTCTHAALTRRRLIELGFKYDTVVMEEAAQVLEVETLLPMVCQRQDMGEKHRLKRVVLIGDHQQLPPVVQSMALQQWSSLEQSMFTRLVRLGVPAVTLNAQGRTRPEIARLFNWRYAASGGLADLPHVSSGTGYAHANAGFAHTHQFVEVDDYNGVGESVPSPHFFQNLGEAEYVVATFMYMRLLGYPAEKISLLTTYNGQKQLLRDVVNARCKPFPWLGEPADITTVDRFQGQQNDFVLLSLVRTRHVGHIRDVRRLVVAMSRARLGLYVFGRLQLFTDCYEIAPVFRQLAQHGTQLMLVPGETHPSARGKDDNSGGNCVPMSDVSALGELVHSMSAVAASAAPTGAAAEESAAPAAAPVAEEAAAPAADDTAIHVESDSDDEDTAPDGAAAAAAAKKAEEEAAAAAAAAKQAEEEAAAAAAARKAEEEAAAAAAAAKQAEEEAAAAVAARKAEEEAAAAAAAAKQAEEEAAAKKAEEEAAAAAAAKKAEEEAAAAAAAPAAADGSSATAAAAFHSAAEGMKLKKAELQALCKDAGLAADGIKKELVGRLMEAWGV